MFHLSNMIIKKVLLLIISFICILYSDTAVYEKFGDNFTIKKTDSGERLTVTAFATDSSCFYLYDMADRSIAQFDSSGTFITKYALQSIGRDTYVGDDFVIRGEEAIFLNTVDKRLEFFILKSGSLKKSIRFPRYIPGLAKQRRYRIISRIFLDSNTIFIGNNHSVFPIDENYARQKTTLSQVRNFPAKIILLLYKNQNSVFLKNRQIEWNQKTVQFKQEGYAMLGKQVGIVNDKLYLCKVDSTGITVTSAEFTDQE